MIINVKHTKLLCIASPKRKMKMIEAYFPICIIVGWMDRLLYLPIIIVLTIQL